MTTIALAGNPNCGKTTLFNALTGTHQHVANWPGVTVEKKTGHFDLGDARVEVVDLPGTYGLSEESSGIDEAIARDYLKSGEVDLVLNVIDAVSLNRSLYLTNELLRMQIPIVVVVNMMDVAESTGVTIDTDALAEKFGCPVIPIAASKRRGIDDVRTAIKNAVPGSAISSSTSDIEIYNAIDQITETITTEPANETTASEKLDNVVLHRFFAFPIFLGVMYLMFLFSINVGSAFIDLLVDFSRTIVYYNNGYIQQSVMKYVPFAIFHFHVI